MNSISGLIVTSQSYQGYHNEIECQQASSRIKQSFKNEKPLSVTYVDTICLQTLDEKYSDRKQ